MTAIEGKRFGNSAHEAEINDFDYPVIEVLSNPYQPSPP